MTSTNLDDGNDDGFTIIELLVSLALLSVITLLGLEGIRTVGFMNRVSKIGADYDLTKTVEKHLVQTISAARPVFYEVNPQKNTLAFNGMKEQLEFVTDANVSVEIGGLYHVRLFTKDGHLLVQRRVFRPRKSLILEKVTKRILLENIDTISFRYFGKRGQKDEAEKWHDEWPKAFQLPKIVEVQILKKSGLGKGNITWMIHMVASKR